MAAQEAHRSWGMAIDLDLCTSCGACAVACHSENNVPPVGPDPARRGTHIHWMELAPRQRPASGGHVTQILPMPCMHCHDAACVKVCPVGATYQTEDGITAQIWDRCIGCRYCQTACPYGRRYFNWTHPEWPEGYRNYINPDVATRPKGVIEKCTFCVHRLRRVQERARVEERELGDEELQRLPACAQACPTTAITFGDLNDSEGQVSKLRRDPRAFRLLEEIGTEPKVFYLGRERRPEE